MDKARTIDPIGFSCRPDHDGSVLDLVRCCRLAFLSLDQDHKPRRDLPSRAGRTLLYISARLTPSSAHGVFCVRKAVGREEK